MAERRLEIDIEMIPSDGGCPQGCSHCPHGIKTLNERGASTENVEPFFSERAVATLASLQQYIVATEAVFESLALATGLNPDRIASLPITNFPRRLSLVLGKVIPEGAVEVVADKIQALVQAIIGTLSLYLGSQRPDVRNPPQLSFSFVPSLSEDLVIQNVESITFLVQQLVLALYTGDVKLSSIMVGLDSNANSDQLISERLNNLAADFKNPTFLSFIGRRVAESLKGEPFNCEKAEEFVNVANNYDRGVIYNHVSQRFKNRFEFILYSRMIAQRLGSETELRDDDPELIVTLLEDEVWIGHASRNTRDRSVRIPYDKFNEIVAECTANKSDLKAALYKEIRAKRGRKKALAVIEA